MKKIIIISLMLLMMFLFTSCAGFIFSILSDNDEKQNYSSADNSIDKQPESSISSEPSVVEESGSEASFIEEESQLKIEISNEEIQIYESAFGTDAIYICEVTNIGNTPVKIDDISVDIEDETGALMTTTKYVSIYPDVIDVGQSAYISEYVINALTDSDLDAGKAAKAVLHYDMEEAEINSVSAEITQISLSVKTSYPTIRGKIKNIGDEDLSDVYISAPIFSSDGKIQAVIFTTIDEIKAGEEIGFEKMGIFCNPDLDYSSSTLGEISIYQKSWF